MQNSLEDSKKESEELKMENDKLIRRNQVLTQNLKELSGRNEKLLQDIQKLESFKYSYNFFTEKFPNCSIEKFIDKFIYLENSCMALTKRICDLEDDKRIIDNEKNNIEKKIEVPINFPAPNNKIWENIDKELEKLIPANFNKKLMNKLSTSEISRQFDTRLHSFFFNILGKRNQQK